MTLDGSLRDACALLRDAVAEKQAPFRTLVLATVDVNGGPDLRTVILRAFDAANRSVMIHTDARSLKVAQLAATPLVALHAWDAGRRLQIRLRGRATRHAGDAVARAAWESLTPLGRQVYRVRQQPGASLPVPDAVQFEELPQATGFAAFMVIEVRYDRLETVLLADHGQIRARFDWSDGGLTSAWLVP
jgi:hypothetical protein